MGHDLIPQAGKERNMNHDILFEPIKIGKVELKNRLVLAPTNTNFSNNHLAGDQTVAWYAARAKGGLGLLVFEATPVSPLAARTSIYNIHHLWGPEHVAALSILTETVHRHGARVFIQLSPGLGVQAAGGDSGVKPKGASPVRIHMQLGNLPKSLVRWYEKYPNRIPALEGQAPEELTKDEIEDLILDFTRACRKAVLSGFDGIEIHSPHGYLVHDFLSPRYNKRSDAYGGTLENRMRFLLRLIRGAREALPEDVALGARLSVDEHNEDGIRFDEMRKVAAAACGAGLDYLHVSDGCYEQAKHFLPEEDGTMLSGAVGFKQEVSVPVVTPCLHNPDNAARAVLEGKTDLVSSSRAFIADPEWANKVRRGQTKEIKKCVRCNRCIFELFSGRPIRCTVNREVGRERFRLGELMEAASAR
jgi:2,4-dienoyl-CoA reductase-like NADH-dependent reductase (Old Yellow Enzyme family)